MKQARSKPPIPGKETCYGKSALKHRFQRFMKPFAYLFPICIFTLLWIIVPSASAQTMEQSSLAFQSNPEGTSMPAGSDTASNTAPTPTQTPDDYYSDHFAHSWDIPEEEAASNTFWIEVDLSAQTLYAYRGDQIINAFLISSGVEAAPTVTGTYKIYAKYSKYHMVGPGYDHPNVPYTMFFNKGYSIHGTYWHDFFGTPMSWGCVNMRTDEAAWIYENAPVGTYVFIHY